MATIRRRAREQDIVRHLAGRNPLIGPLPVTAVAHVPNSLGCLPATTAYPEPDPGRFVSSQNDYRRRISAGETSTGSSPHCFRHELKNLNDNCTCAERIGPITVHGQAQAIFKKMGLIFYKENLVV